MNAEVRRRNAQAEREKAADALEEARLLSDAGKWRGAVSRGSYGLFPAVRALLVPQGLEAKTPPGVETLFGQHFVRPGELDLVARFHSMVRERLG